MATIWLSRIYEDYYYHYYYPNNGRQTDWNTYPDNPLILSDGGFLKVVKLRHLRESFAAKTLRYTHKSQNEFSVGFGHSLNPKIQHGFITEYLEEGMDYLGALVWDLITGTKLRINRDFSPIAAARLDDGYLYIFSPRGYNSRELLFFRRRADSYQLFKIPCGSHSEILDIQQDRGLITISASYWMDEQKMLRQFLISPNGHVIQTLHQPITPPQKSQASFVGDWVLDDQSYIILYLLGEYGDFRIYEIIEAKSKDDFSNSKNTLMISSVPFETLNHRKLWENRMNKGFVDIDVANQQDTRA